jgi:hypothetical protein
MESVAGVAALASGALRGGKEAEFFIIADGGGVEASAGGEFADFHRMAPGSRRGAVYPVLDTGLALS